MREIKFRAYVKDKKKVLPVYSLGFSGVEMSPVMIASCGNLECGLCFDYYEREDVEIMQYTGLKDKNGKEVYEGDIVNVPKRDWVGVVIFTGDCQYALKGKSILGNDAYLMFTQFYLNESEVIGNIYENAELVGADIEGD